MIHENRDPVFWERVLSHPDVEHVKNGWALDVAAIVSSPSVTPIASESGGFLLFRLDGLGRVYEMHTAYLPEGRGREVHRAAGEMFNLMFGRAELITTYEGYPPPKSFGWKTAGGFSDSPIGMVRTWFLTKEAWEQSPARRRICR